jgi:general secretion pathway protein G
MNKKRNGYTLIELLVVITIIVILGALSFVSYGYISGNSRNAKRKSDLEQVRSALEMYRADKGYYPNGAASYTTISSAPNTPGEILLDDGYINALPADPKDNTLYPYKIIMTDPSSGHYYGYCLAAYTEGIGTLNNACTGVTPPESYYYIVKNP